MLLTGTAAINGTGNGLNNVMRGNGSANVLDGGDGNDTLYGGNGSDTLNGGNGIDHLDGGTGADSMTGGAGDDTYYVDNAGDSVTENASEGTDVVYSSVSFTLGTNVEKMVLTGLSAIDGTGNGLVNVINGNSAANNLSGGDGNDTIYGGGGVDMLTGGIGNDTFVFTDISDSLPGSADTITDFVSNAGEGSDDQIDLSGID